MIGEFLWIGIGVGVLLGSYAVHRGLSVSTVGKAPFWGVLLIPFLFLVANLSIAIRIRRRFEDYTGLGVTVCAYETVVKQATARYSSWIKPYIPVQ